MKALLIVLYLTNLVGFAVAQKSVVEGHISGYPNGTAFVITPYKADGSGDNELEHAIVLKDGHFTIELALGAPTYFSLRNQPDDPAQFENLNFWVDSSATTISGRRGALEFSHVEGGHVQRENEAYVLSQQRVRQRIKEIHDIVVGKQKIKDDDRQRLRAEYKALQDMILSSDLKFIEDHSDFLMSASLLSFYCSYRPDVLSMERTALLYRGFSTTLKESIYGPVLEQYIDGVPVNKRLSIGDASFDFTLPDSTGRERNLRDFKGKVILLDFWASGCGPCRQEHENYLRIFRRFHSKGFEIVSVNQDTEERRWTTAMKKDSMEWVSLWDVSRKVTRQVYAVTYIPANFLIDQTGHVIATDIRGKPLAVALEALFVAGQSK